MKKICVIPMSARTGSTYLTRFMKKYKNCFYSGEFLKPEYIYQPYINEYPAKNISNEIPDSKVLSLINSNLELYISTLKKNWNSEWYFLNCVLDKNLKANFDRRYEPIEDEVNITIQNNIDILFKTKYSIIFKLYPQWFKKYEVIKPSILTNIKEDLQLIFLKRRNILDICMSIVLAAETGLFTYLYKEHKYSIPKKFNCNLLFIKSIFEGIIEFEKIKKELKDIESTTIYYEDIFNYTKEELLEKLNLKIEDENDFILPKKLYKSISFEEKLSCIENQEEFYNEYNKGMELLKEKGIEI
jgi:hypothetical protein